ncbi:hypothetical protein [Candidatus Sororendozoicomonas aggregata]|uniref:hypothetical protein n=1 Tax=Candidatus Sororendozoicomonas aggregata TaxID=3073239 RepID=UPI002ED5AAC8
MFKGINKLLGDFAPFVAIAIAAFVPGAEFLWGTLANTATAAVATGFVAGGIATGSLKGAFVGAFSAGVFHGIGTSFQEGAWARGFFGSSATGAKVAAHGLAGGVMSVLNGGKFGNGFASAGFTQLLAPGIGAIDKGTRFSARRVFAASIVGGTSSATTGGKFANGAVTGAFSRAMNDESHWRDRVNLALAQAKDKLQQLSSWAVKNEKRIFSTMQAIGGAGQALFGAGLCTTTAGCVFGAPIIAHGLSNYSQGVRFTDTNIVQEAYKAIFGNDVGNSIYYSVDIISSIGAGSAKTLSSYGRTLQNSGESLFYSSDYVRTIATPFGTMSAVNDTYVLGGGLVNDYGN